jgi:hypothetical protein
MIFVGLILLLFTKWIWAAGFLLADGVSFLGHIEGNRPAFFKDRSICWSTNRRKEAWMFLTGAHRRPASENTP